MRKQKLEGNSKEIAYARGYNQAVDDSKKGSRNKANCKKCGNPVVMFWCAECEANCEDKVCIDCGKATKLDKDYHKECDFTKNQSITIPMSENDLWDLQSGEEFDWTFETESGESIDVHIRQETEEDFNE